jgi:hypothetical protein
MKAILEFNLDDVSDRLAHKRCVNAANAYIALFEVNEELRQINKYGDGTDKVDVGELRETIFDIFDANGINLDDLE